MRILQVVNAFYPCQIWGGPPQVVLDYSKGLQARGHDLHVLTHNILDEQRRITPHTSTGEWQGIPVTYLQAYWWLRRKHSMGLIWTPSILTIAQRIRAADVVIVHGYRHALFTTSILFAQLFRVPYVVMPHGSLPGELGRVRLKRIFDRLLGPATIGRAAGAIALNDDEAQRLQVYGITAQRIAHILNPFDTRALPAIPDQSAFRERYGIAPDEKIILFLSRLHEKKGLDLLIEAFAQLDRDRLRLCIVGPDHGYETTARALIETYGLQERTLFTGALYDQEKYAAYAAANVYVLPTRGVEGFPVTVMEACYVGVPQVLTRTSGAAQLVDGVAGIAVDPDAAQLATAIRQVLTDPARAQQFRQGGAQLVEQHFQYDRAIAQLDGLLAAIVAR